MIKTYIDIGVRKVGEISRIFEIKGEALCRLSVFLVEEKQTAEIVGNQA